MKKKSLLFFTLFFGFVFSQQITISFENGQGYNLGNINGQNGWTTPKRSGVPITSQIITDELASNGSQSLKILPENGVGPLANPTVGAFYNLTADIPITNFTISFDINITQINTTNYVFRLVNGQAVMSQLSFEKNGIVKLWDFTSGTNIEISTTFNWNINTWYRVKAIGTASGNIEYYLNNVLIATVKPGSMMSIKQLRFVHTNNGGSAYIDNIAINNEQLSVKESVAGTMTGTYPNPVSDYLYLKSGAAIVKAEIFDLTGKKIRGLWSGHTLDLRNLQSGIYLINITTKNEVYTQKIIKK